MRNLYKPTLFSNVLEYTSQIKKLIFAENLWDLTTEKAMTSTSKSFIQSDIAEKDDAFLNDITSWIPSSENLPAGNVGKLTVRTANNPYKIQT